MEIEDVPAGTVVVRQGDRAHAFFTLLEGAAIVERDGLPIACLGPGAEFGELALLTYTRRTATVTTTTAARIAIFPVEEFRRLVDTDRSFSRRAFAAAASRR
jgi:CRP-like cAMP-binding protein